MKNDYDESEGNKILRNQLEFYKKNDVVVHILKNDGRFSNGKVLEVSSDMVIIDDRVDGATPIHFLEINVLEKYREREDGDNGYSI